MKKVLLSLALVAVAATSAFAQIPQIGIKGGVNIAKLNASAGNISASTESVTSFSAGAFVDFKLGAVSLQPGLYYTGKGGSDGNGNTIRLNYLQVPVNFVYHAPIVVGDIFFGAGPYAAYGLSAKGKDASGVTIDGTFGDGPDDVKRTDLGLNGIAGIHLKTGLLLGINYDLGLSNITNDSSISTRNRVLGFSIGYTF
ncbi:porin family protein [Mucilaginibacter pedocola]|uniref:Outer membrane protein beta-barrel domain-containing protein n=1 Tax=Mucilaginibacter pedocola TaxID=1792845 RepID=A0A1S9P7F8_9SPHI|nr:porin family protein [Mucilaginibacter pedocola]OOQ56885.1 hypothetical protein BC343_18075 [Mucilaginibacter pedocola]